jgi:hypothetical protein
MDAIFFVLRTGGQWNALRGDGHLFAVFGASALSGTGCGEVFRAFHALRGIGWTWLALDGTIGMVPRGGGEPAPTRWVAASAG